MKRIAVLLLILGVGFGLSLAPFSWAGAGEPEVEEEVSRESSIPDADSKMCDLASRYMASLKVSCSEKFQHYEPRSPSAVLQSGGTIRIGQWNVFNLGIDKQRFKDLDVLADIVTRESWDVFAATELFPVSGTVLAENLRLEKFVKELESRPSGAGEAADVIANIQWHGAVRLLLALQKRDPSWALLLAPKSLGSEGSSALETGGVYYRASRVRPVQNEHCQSFGCLAQLPSSLFPGIDADLLEEVVSREPFIASFATHDGRFDFTVIPFHARFRHPKKVGIMEAIAGAQIGASGKVVFGRGLFFEVDSVLGKTKADEFRARLQKEIEDRLSGKKMGPQKKDSTKELLARYAELAALGRFMNHLSKQYREKDIIWTGDFNLEYDLDPDRDTATEAKLRRDWDTILLKNQEGWQGSVVWVKEPTSLSDKERLKSNYDHFILNPKHTSECREASARALDFTDLKVAPLMSNYTALLNEPVYRANYESLPPKSVQQLLEIAAQDPAKFQTLSEETRLGLTLTEANRLEGQKTSDKEAFELRRKELEELLVDLQRRRMLAHLASPVGQQERRKIAARVLNFGSLLQSQWGVFPDTLDGQVIESFQPKFPKPDDLISPEREKRAQEYQKILDDYARRVFDSQWMVDPRTAKDIRYQVFREIVSDHLPIQVDCAVPTKDDD